MLVGSSLHTLDVLDYLSVACRRRRSHHSCRNRRHGDEEYVQLRADSGSKCSIDLASLVGVVSQKLQKIGERAMDVGLLTLVLTFTSGFESPREHFGFHNLLRTICVMMIRTKELKVMIAVATRKTVMDVD